MISMAAPTSDETKTKSFLEQFQIDRDLYGLIHARFIKTKEGLELMRKKVLENTFGICPRVLCKKQKVLPIGLSEDLAISRLKVYCPKCHEVYYPRLKLENVDGAYFGCSFPFIFLEEYPEFVTNDPVIYYIPKVFGFKIYAKKGSKFNQNTNKTDSNKIKQISINNYLDKNY